MSNKADIEEKLATLTVRQCQVLHMVCHGQGLQDIANELSFSVETINKDMGRIYQVFGFKRLNNAQKRGLLIRTICPIHDLRVSDPQTDCATKGVIEAGPEPPVDSQSMALVVMDWGTVIPVSEESMLPAVPDDPQWPPYPPPPPPGGGNILLKLLVGLLVALVLLGVGGGAMFLLMGGKILAPGSSPGAEVIVVTSPPLVVPQSAATTAPQAAPTATPVQLPTPTSTTIPSPTPTRPVDTPAGTVLNIGQGWRQDNAILTLTRIVTEFSQSYDCRIGLIFQFENLTPSSIVVAPDQSMFSVVDNTGNAWKYTGLDLSVLCPDFKPSSRDRWARTVQPGFRYPGDGWFVGFNGNLTDRAINQLIVTVTDLYHFNGAKWKIPINN